MKPVKSSVHSENISGMKISTLGIFIDQVSENDIKRKRENIWLKSNLNRIESCIPRIYLYIQLTLKSNLKVRF